MKTVEQINKEIMQLGILRQGDRIPIVLRGWAEEIVDECAGKLSDDGAIQEGWLWQKIMKVKQEL